MTERKPQMPAPLTPEITREMAEGVLNPLTDIERRVIQLRFGLLDADPHMKTQSQVGEEIGRSRWTVGRIEKRALQGLKKTSKYRDLFF